MSDNLNSYMLNVTASVFMSMEMIQLELSVRAASHTHMSPHAHRHPDRPGRVQQFTHSGLLTSPCVLLGAKHWGPRQPEERESYPCRQCSLKET